MDVAVSEGATVVCSNCGEVASTGDLYCESCGSPLPGTVAESAPVPVPPAEVSGAGAGLTSSRCPQCGGGEFLDGYCTSCGAPAVRERDHFAEQPAPWVAALSDRGVRHHRNEDAMALSALPTPGSRAVLVVCDGVSSSLDSDIASLAAARAARDVLTTSQTPGGPAVAARVRAWSELLVEATEAANAQAVEVARTPTDRPSVQTSPPSCTFVAAVVDGPLVVIGWVGDSRAYWVPDLGTAEQLTLDDSWAAEQMAIGVSRADAESSPQAHAITRWLGSDSPDILPRCVSLSPPGPGWLLVCSDGLWNYCSAPEQMAAVVEAAVGRTGADPARAVEELVNWANEQGGHDNITVALARLGDHG
jgi:serine/threonine protein phosphatase PrpC